MSIKDIKNLIKSNMYIGGHGFQHEHFSILSKKEKAGRNKKKYSFFEKNWSKYKKLGHVLPLRYI